MLVALGCGVLVTGCGLGMPGPGATPLTMGATPTQESVNQPSAGRDWPFKGVTGGVITCDPARPGKSLFRVTQAVGTAAQYIGRTWALNGDPAYPAPPSDIWVGDITGLASDAPYGCL